MILGIVAAIAAPRVLGAAGAAADNSARQTLSVIREAIDSYAAHHPDELPGADGQESTFINDLRAYLRGAEFPKCQVGPVKNNSVRMTTGVGPIADEATDSWVYKYDTGEFHINSDDTAKDGTPYNQF
jgi:type II secretory pathway pseudopilin PulG